MISIAIPIRNNFYLEHEYHMKSEEGEKEKELASSIIQSNLHRKNKNDKHFTRSIR